MRFLNQHRGTSRSRLVLAGALVVSVCGGLSAGIASIGGKRGTSYVDRVRPRSVRLIPAPRGGIFDTPVWLPAIRRVVFVYDTGGPAWNQDLYSLPLKAGSARPKRLPLPRDASCEHVSHGIPVKLPSGKLAYLEKCFSLVRPPSRAVSLNEYDPLTGSAQPLVPYRLPFRTGFYTFSPGMTRALIDNGDTVQVATGRMVGPKRIPIHGARFPVWSPDGRWVVLAGVSATVGINARLGASGNLYLLDGHDLRDKVLQSNVDQVGLLAWSPDSRWLVGPLKPNGRPAGLWLIEVSSGRLTLLLGGTQFGAATWLPDGQTIIAAVGVLSNLPRATGMYGSARAGLLMIRLPHRF